MTLCYTPLRGPAQIWLRALSGLSSLMWTDSWPWRVKREGCTVVLGPGAEGWSSGGLESLLFDGLSLLSFLSVFLFFFFPIPSPLLPWAKDINQGLPSPLLKLYLFVLITIYISHTQSSPPKRIYHLSISTPDKICPLCLLSGPRKSPALKKIKGHDFFRWYFVGFQLYKSQNDEQSVCETTFLNQRHNVPRSDRPLIFQFQLL